tara:strand:- start:3383 stop:4249 length:867 start_codon:yes stop_codon:yes gene_type:complete
MKVLIITPAFNEEKHLQLLINSVISQTYQPAEWIIVDDASTDSTSNIIQHATINNKWIRYLRKSDEDSDYYNSALEAFYFGFKKRLNDDYDIIMKLDADLILPNKYLESIISEFERNANIGICGGVCVVKNYNSYKIESGTNLDHIRGAIKSYRKSCFDQIGGISKQMGWDTLDEHTARYKGWKVKVLANLHVIHQRSTAETYGVLKASFRNGKILYYLRMDFLLVIGNAVKKIIKKPYFLISIYLVAGYLYSFFIRNEQIKNKDLGKFIRRYRYKKIIDRFIPFLSI